MASQKKPAVTIEIKTVPLSDIILNPDNPRQISQQDMDRLVKSLTEFPDMMSIREIVVDETMTVLGGNMRTLALRKIGAKECTAKIVRGLTPAQKREFVIKDNAAFGAWDMDVLANAWDDLPLAEWGVDIPEDWANLAEEPTGHEDDVPEVPEEPVTKTGDLYILGNHRLLCGDSTCATDVERLMDGKKSRMIFTDPPYNVDYGVSKNPRHKIRQIQNDQQDAESWERFCKDLYGNMQAFNTGDIYMFGASGPEGMKMRLWLVEMGAHWSATIIWRKNNLVLTPANYQRKYEPCFYGWFEKSSYNGSRTETEVWEIDRPRDSKLHPTMKPVDLVQKAIDNSSKQKDIVLDLFGGSGSTIIAAELTNRSCYAMEIDPHYCDVIVRRWEEYTGKKAVLS